MRQAPSCSRRTQTSKRNARSHASLRVGCLRAISRLFGGTRSPYTRCSCWIWLLPMAQLSDRNREPSGDGCTGSAPRAFHVMWLGRHLLVALAALRCEIPQGGSRKARDVAGSSPRARAWVITAHAICLFCIGLTFSPFSNRSARFFSSKTASILVSSVFSRSGYLNHFASVISIKPNCRF
jgi:hypothetical protein